MVHALMNHIWDMNSDVNVLTLLLDLCVPVQKVSSTHGMFEILASYQSGVLGFSVYML